MTLPNIIVENEINVNYSETEQLVLSLDIVQKFDSVKDYEAYIIISELSGNDINYKVKYAIGSVEVDMVSGTLSANKSILIVLDKPLKYNLYLSSTTSGLAKIAYRIILYR